MNNDPFGRIGLYYDELVKRHGHDPRACDYGQAESQRIKFRVLSQVMDLEGASVLDVGCGFCDFADFLAPVPGLRYTGLDITASMVDEAKRLHPDLDVVHANFLEYEPGGPFDLITANGIFYLLGTDAWDLMQRLVAKMYACARKAVAFNTLSAWAPDMEEGEFYADPAKVVDFCRTLTPWVVLRHDYHTRDFTIYLYKERRS